MHEKIEDLVKENRLNPNEHDDFRQLNMFQGWVSHTLQAIYFHL